MSNIHVSVDLVAAARRSETLREIPSDVVAKHVVLYLRFLELARKHAGPITPTREIDQIWHLHMLHPVAYYDDCMRIFGRILDHDGGFGAVPEERPALGRAFERTARLWQAEFRERYVEGEVTGENCWHDCQNRCWHDCSSKAFSTGDACLGEAATP